MARECFANALRTGATFMKFGRAPTTWRIWVIASIMKHYGLNRVAEPSSVAIYCTVSVRLVDWAVDPEVAVTVSVYFPAGVPLGFDGGGLLELLPPPQEQINNRSVNGSQRRAL